MPYEIGGERLGWPKGVKGWSISLIGGGIFLGWLMLSPFPILGLIVGTVLVGAGIVVGLFGLSRWIFRKLRVRLAVEIFPKLPKEP